VRGNRARASHFLDRALALSHSNTQDALEGDWREPVHRIVGVDLNALLRSRPLLFSKQDDSEKGRGRSEGS
jgi:hypothetical protein